MALDAANHRLFIGGRNPARLVVLDTDTAKIATSVEGVGHTDDLWYDGAHKRIWPTSASICPAGWRDRRFEQRDMDHYALIARIPSVPGASTSFFVPDLNRLYVPAKPYGRPALISAGV
jgi:hypothetical protein